MTAVRKPVQQSRIERDMRNRSELSAGYEPQALVPKRWAGRA